MNQVEWELKQQLTTIGFRGVTLRRRQDFYDVFYDTRPEDYTDRLRKAGWSVRDDLHDSVARHITIRSIYS